MTDDLQTADVARVADAAARGELIHEGDRPGLRYVRHYRAPRRPRLASDHRVRSAAALDALRHRRRADGGRGDHVAVLARARGEVRHRRADADRSDRGLGAAATLRLDLGR